MVSILTDQHFFDTANKSSVAPIHGATNSEQSINGELLLVLDWGNTVEFVYDAFSIFISQTTITPQLEVQSFENRAQKDGEEIIQSYISDHTNKQADSTPSVKNILACNPQKYPPHKLLSQYI